ncbi:aldolase/citrate lyase family protein [Methylocystis sp. S23]|jgi:citrate lyase subunit beta/citryl-CoA lyase
MRSFLVLSPHMRGSCDAPTSGAPALLLRLGEGEARAADRIWARGVIERARASSDRPRLFVQVAPASDVAIDADLAALVRPGLDGVFLEACEGRAHLQRVSAKLAVHEAEAGLPAGAVGVVALAAQTPASVFALGGYKGASTRLIGLAMDATPLPGGEGARRMARGLLLLAAAAAGAAAFDFAPDLAGAALDAACAAARREGFAGMIARSAAQMDAVERAFHGT